MPSGGRLQADDVEAVSLIKMEHRVVKRRAQPEIPALSLEHTPHALPERSPDAASTPLRRHHKAWHPKRPARVVHTRRSDGSYRKQYWGNRYALIDQIFIKERFFLSVESLTAFC